MTTPDKVATLLTVHWRADALEVHDQLYLSGVDEAQVLRALDALLMAWGDVQGVDALAHDPRRLVAVQLRRPGALEAMTIGRWYPAALFAGVPDAVELVQLTDTDGSAMTVDCNHPLARAEVSFDVARVVQLPSVPGRLEAPLKQKLGGWLFGGVGLQAYPLRELFDSPAACVRQDASSDAAFYAQPRLVQHIDSFARTTMADWYAASLGVGAEVLDLMSSWVTHLPQWRDDLRVDGLGMNEYELSRNPMLRDYFVHDLNRTPALPDMAPRYARAVCSVSVEYLTDPVAVFASVAGTLETNGSFANAFSNRCFPTKAVALWGQLQPFERMALVADFYAQSGAYGPCRMQSISGAPRPPDDDYAYQIADADPVYLVTADTL